MISRIATKWPATLEVDAPSLHLGLDLLVWPCSSLDDDPPYPWPQCEESCRDIVQIDDHSVS